MLRRKVGSQPFSSSSSSPPSQQKKSSKKTKKKSEESQSKPAKKIRIFSYFGRQVNLDFHDKDANVYQLLRSWVQNDPECDVSGPHDVLRSLLPAPRNDVAELPPRPPVGHKPMQDVNYINSLQSVNSQSLLESHLVYMKAVRKWMSTRRHRRRSKYTKRLQALCPGFEMTPVITPGKRITVINDIEEVEISKTSEESSSPKKKRRRLSVDTSERVEN
jgi:hypothetical protein